VAQDPREELQALTSAVRAYVNWHSDTGTTGFPRNPRVLASAPVPTPAREAQPPAAAEGTNSPPQPQHSIANDLPDFVPPAEIRDSSLPAQRRTRADSGAQVASNANDTQAITAVTTLNTAALTSGARDSAKDRVQLTALAATANACTKCNLHTHRSGAAFARGNPDAALCFIGDSTLLADSVSGAPFSGGAGELLNRMIFAMGLDPDKQVYICNLVKCPAPDDREPTPAELSACAEHIDMQLALVPARVLVALGQAATSHLLRQDTGLVQLRGQWKLYRGRTLLMPTHHPVALLQNSSRQAALKKEVWEDLQLVMKELGLGKPRKSTK
jgi:uracil-DNA glycosylase